MGSLANGMSEAEERISELQHASLENTKIIRNVEGEMNKAKKNIQELNDIIKILNIMTIGVPEGMGREV